MTDSLAPPDYVDPVVEAYKQGVDRTPLRENLKLSVDERFRKFEAVARLACAIYELRNDRYEEVGASKSFPILTHDVLADFLEKSSVSGQTQALSDFREWLRGAGA